MEHQARPSLPLPPISFDAGSFTSFGPPPANPEDDESRRRAGRSGSFLPSMASRFVDSLLGNISSAFRSGRQNVEPNLAATMQPQLVSSQDSKTPSIMITGPSRKTSRNNSESNSANSPSTEKGPPSWPGAGREARSPSYRLTQLTALFRGATRLEMFPAVVGLNAIWASDETCNHCYDCSVKFTTFNRRHHCRFCGRIFCDSCSRFRIPGQPFGIDDGLRACEVCYRQTLRVLLEDHATSISEEILERLASLYVAIGGYTPPIDQSQSSTGGSAVTLSPNSAITLQVPVARSRSGSLSGGTGASSEPKQPSSPKVIKRQPSTPLPALFPGSPPLEKSTDELLSELAENKKTPTEKLSSSATVKMSDLVTPPQTPLSLHSNGLSSSPGNSVPKHFNFVTEHHPGAKGAKPNLMGQQLTAEIDQAIGDSLKQVFGIDDRQAGVIAGIYRTSDVEASLRRLYKLHLTRICSHLLAVEQLDAEKWQRNLLQIVYQVTRILRPQPRRYPDTLDVRRCVKIKKIFDPSLSAHFEYVDGIVFTKSLSHRLMQTSVQNPRILLIQNGLDFERENQQMTMTNLDVIVNQEAEQMQRYVSQIASVRPTVLFCGGTIPTLACKKLIEGGISAASYVKPHILEQVARFTDAEILPSVDSLSLSGAGQSPVRLGFCRTFASFSVHLHTRLQKTFLCLSGCDPIGCSIVIRDDCYADLVKVKKILRWLMAIAHDGVATGRYLVAFRADPFSLEVSNTPQQTNENLPTSPEEEKFPGEDSRRVIASRRSFSGKRDSAVFSLVQQIRHRRKLSIMSSLITSPDPVLPGTPRSSISNINAAFALTNSGLLTMSPLLRLPDPSKKSAQFDASPSRTYYEAPLFSLLAASYERGNQMSFDPTKLVAPLATTRCVQKKLHDFFTTPLVDDFSSERFQEKLIDFRRSGSLFEIVDDLTPRKSSHGSNETARPSSDLIADQSRPMWVKPLCFGDCQYLQVLVSVFSPDSQLSPYHCCYGPCLESWSLYESPDHSLGAFLHEHCFVPGVVCQRQGCGALRTDHIRRFASSSGRVDVIIRPIIQPIVQPSTNNNSEDQQPVVTWSMCRQCQAITPLTQPNDALWEISFASYLQRKFDAVDHTCVPLTTGSTKCQHAYEKNYLQFFAKDRLIAVVKHSPIDVRDIVIPHLKVTESLQNQSSQFTSSLQQQLTALTPDGSALMKAATKHFDSVIGYLETLRSNLQILLGVPPSKAIIDRLLSQESLITTEGNEFKDTFLKIEQIINGELQRENGAKSVEEMILGLFQTIQLSWLDWNERLRSFVRFVRSEAISMTQAARVSAEVVEPEMEPVQLAVFKPPQISVAEEKSPTAGSLTGESPPLSMGVLMSTELNNNDPTSKEVWGSFTNEVFTIVDPPVQSKQTPLVSIPISSSLSGKTFVGSLLDLLTDADLLSHPLFRTKLKLPMEMPFNAGHHYAFPNKKLAYPVAVLDEEPSSLIAFVLSSETYRQQLTAKNLSDGSLDKTLTPPPLNAGVKNDDAAANGSSMPRKSTATASVSFGELNSLAVVSEDAEEPSRAPSTSTDDLSSQISMTGALDDDLTTTTVPAPTPSSSLSSSRVSTPAPSSPKVFFKKGQENVASVSSSISPLASSTPLNNNKPANKNEARKDSRHITIEWTSASIDKDALVKFSVTAYHAAIFDEIRRIILPSNGQQSNNANNSKGGNGQTPPFTETYFVQSLARCKSWKATGGKSGVTYYKTQDGRFILKQIQKAELQSIFDMAPAYLEYIRSSREQKRPSVLVPVLGAFQVVLENSLTGRSYKYDLIVMEYLFRSHVISEKFDLKGSQRNRLVKTSSKQALTWSGVSPVPSASDLESKDPSHHHQDPHEHVDIVLLDENLLIKSLQDPLYVYPHSKKLLLQAIASDTSFLANNYIMDYSLLVGVDKQNHSLVVGIIDYLRTFTWDKKVESVVKASGLLGGQGKAPTIVAPDVYRRRFNTAMRHFFLEVPDAWLAYETHNFARQ